eukprot:TRINITY_DN28164_c0_g2_i1.p1 TRINITY_DN28164_c0_g2~~TRINITY_DN28164_c0_g2_i1.p1  ORF type:complete len:398 (-),score=26.88 TRINITY_DN28164_c0_g2_i1:331-1524(-)
MQRRITSSSSDAQSEQVQQHISRTHERSSKGSRSLWSLLTNDLFLAVIMIAIFVYMLQSKRHKQEVMRAPEPEQICTYMYNATDPEIIPETPHAAIIATHHRTGTQLFFGMMRMFALSYGYSYYQYPKMDFKQETVSPQYVGVRQFSNKQIIVAQHGFEETCKENYDQECEWFDSDCYLKACELIPPPKEMENELKIVQIVRNPVEIVISSYLYHKQDPPPEAWVGEPKPELIPDNFQRFKSRPYNQFLINAPPQVALVVEFSRQLGELYILARNCRDMANVPNAKNVRFEDVKRDMIGKSQQVFEFLQIMHPTMCREQFAEFLMLGFDLKHIDLSVYENVTKVKSHVTEGKHNKKHLAQILYNDPNAKRILTQLAEMMGYEEPFKRLQGWFGRRLS